MSTQNSTPIEQKQLAPIIGAQITNTEEFRLLPTGTIAVDDDGTSYRVGHKLELGPIVVVQDRRGKQTAISVFKDSEYRTHWNAQLLPENENTTSWGLFIVYVPPTKDNPRPY